MFLRLGSQVKVGAVSGGFRLFAVSFRDVDLGGFHLFAVCFTV